MLAARREIQIPDDLWVIEAAAYLRVDKSTIYRRIKSKDIRAVKVEGRWHIAKAELDAILAGDR